VAMDCGAISKELAGSELFGHEKGAFTGALTTKIGHFELANGGTLFLDEVANLSYDVQTSLLRVVQERKVKHIGGNKEIPFDVRIVVASNENLSEACRKGKFREDLFHRFNEFNLSVPALRQRQADIMVFAGHYLAIANKELNKTISGFSDDVVDSFMKYAWPGNVRELKNVVKRAALLAKGDVIAMSEVPAEILQRRDFTISGGSSMMQEENAAPNLKQTAHEAEYQMILDVLKKVNYNKTKAAKLLNIDRKTLYNKMKAFDL
jgi:two-component system, NtrC family, response regulator HydG